MVKNTVRDQIWEAAISLAVGGLDERPDLGHEWYNSSYEGVGFVKDDLLERADAGDRTVHDVLKTMVDMGLLGERRRALYRPYENPHGIEKAKRVTLTVYYAAGELASGSVDYSELIGYDRPSADVDEDDLEDIREKVGIQ
jgi:hypothetical protein